MRCSDSLPLKPAKSILIMPGSWIRRANWTRYDWIGVVRPRWPVSSDACPARHCVHPTRPSCATRAPLPRTPPRRQIHDAEYLLGADLREPGHRVEILSRREATVLRSVRDHYTVD